jgi:hypothetical protein
MALKQDIEIWSGNDTEINATITDTDAGAAKDLTGAAVTWILAKAQGKPALITKTVGSGITLTTPLQGKCKVTLVPTDTEALKGTKTYYHEMRVVDAATKKVTVLYGDVLLQENSITG